MLTSSAREDFPEQAAMTVLMGLGVERNLAHKTAYAKFKSVNREGHGLLANTLGPAAPAMPLQS